MINAIAAIGKNRVLGKDNRLLWHIPDDLKLRFKELTLGHPVIMGRKTYDSVLAILGKPYPGRTSIVLMREAEFNPEDPTLKFENVIVAHSPEEAVQKAKELNTGEVFIGGGAQIYALMLPHVERLYLTLIDDQKEGDAFFPPYEHLFTKKIKEETREHNGLKYVWVDLEKE